MTVGLKLAMNGEILLVLPFRPFLATARLINVHAAKRQNNDLFWQR
ncbi:hypothetical protein [Pseudomonas sp. v388]|nr:hypothetical protein [Pseudomonas sp. v388]